MSSDPNEEQNETFDLEDLFKGFDFENDYFVVDNQKYHIDDDGNIYRLRNDVNEDQSEEPESVDSLVEEQEEDLENIDNDLTDSDLMKNSPEEDNAIKNKTKGESDLVETTTENIDGSEDLEPFQETKETKPDGAFSMMERNIAECQRKSDYKKSREECAKEVKKKMAEKDMPIIETKDTEDEIETKEEEVEETETKKDTIEICPKELDMLKEKAEKYDQLKEEHDSLQKEHDSFKNDFLKFKEKMDNKEKAEMEAKRQEIIDKISYDFEIPKDELKEDSIEELEKLQKRLTLALNVDMEEEPEEEDMENLTADAIHKRYFCEV